MLLVVGKGLSFILHRHEARAIDRRHAGFDSPGAAPE
jgi:hypothetical protein